MNLKKIFAHATENFKLSLDGIHGPGHWKAVLKNGRELCKRVDADLQVVELFAVLHDCKRENDTVDPDHGKRAAKLAQEMNGKFFQLSNARLELLCEALKNHNKSFVKSENSTIGVCWDSDRLDFYRTGFPVNPRELQTAEARKKIKRDPTSKFYHYTAADTLPEILESGFLKPCREGGEKKPAVWLSKNEKWENAANPARLNGPNCEDFRNAKSIKEINRLFTEKPLIYLSVDKVAFTGVVPARIVISEKVQVYSVYDFFQKALDAQGIQYLKLFLLLWLVPYVGWGVSYEPIPASAFERIEVYQGGRWVEWVPD